jgi:hypothetical protein
MGMSLKYLAVFTLMGLVLFSSGQQTGDFEAFAWYLLGLLLFYRISLWRHPVRRCWRCNGRARHYGAVWRYAWRLCTLCGGNGRALRHGASALGIPETSPRRNA